MKGYRRAMTYPKIHIVIVGGGFGGVACVRACAKRFARRPDVAITLITPRPFHEFAPALYVGASEIDATQCADHGLPRAGSDQAGEAGHAVEKALCMPLEDILRGTRVKTVYGYVRKVDVRARTVSVDHHAPLHYSYLVLAMGCEMDYFDIPGLAAHAYPLKTVKDAMRLRGALERCMRKTGGMVVIGGGGFTGAELAAELAWVAKCRGYPVRIVLVEGLTPVLAQLGEKASGMARARLIQLGVELAEGARVQAVEGGEGGRVTVRLNNQQTHEADLVVWTGGVRGNRLYQHMFPIYTGTQWRVGVEESLQVVGEKNIFAVGDGAYLETNKFPKGLPLQARVAIEEGKCAAENIARMTEGRPLRSFSCAQLPYVIPLGGRFAVAVYRGRVRRGFLPWIFKQAIELRYFVEVLGWRKGLQYWMREEKMCVSE